MFFRSKGSKDRSQPASAATREGKSVPPPAKSPATGASDIAPAASQAPAERRAATAAPAAVEGGPAATSAIAPALGDAKPLPPDELKRRAEISKRLATTRGEIVALLLRSPPYRDQKLSDLRWLMFPPLRTGQYALIEAQSKQHGYTAPVAGLYLASSYAGAGGFTGAISSGASAADLVMAHTER